MENPHQRKKEPEALRQKIIEHAIRLASEKGAAGVSIQGVADLAGVTKGGVFHHFPSKQRLLQAMVQEVLRRLDAAVDEYVGQDPEPQGCFSRAYIHFTLQTDASGIGTLWSAISMTMLTDHAFNVLWMDWLNARLARHQHTDSGMGLKLLRYAADGVWLAVFIGAEPPEKMQEVQAELMRRTYL